MKSYTISADFIYNMKLAINTFFINNDEIYKMFDVIEQSFGKYFDTNIITTELNCDERLIKIKINDLFVNDQREIRVDAHEYNLALNKIQRAHDDAINAFLNNNKGEIYSILRMKNKQYADLFLETIPVVASQLSMMWGHPVFNKSSMVVNIRLY